MKAYFKSDQIVQTLWLIAISVAILVSGVVTTNHFLGPLVSFAYVLAFVGFSGWMLLIGIDFIPLQHGRLMQLVVAGIVVAQLFALFVVRSRLDIQTDRDSALIVWLEELGAGRYPYAEPTNLGNPISVFPFLPLLGLPFLLLGNIGLLQIAAYPVAVVLLMRTYDVRRVQVWAVGILSSSPVLWIEILARSDLFTNLVLLLAFIHLLELVEKRDTVVPNVIILGVLLGALGATRLALYPAFLSYSIYILRTFPRSDVMKVGVTAVGVSLAMLVPFIIWDADTFFNYAPFGVNSEKLGESDALQYLLTGTTAVLALAGGWLAQRATDLYIVTSVVMLVVALSTIVLFFADLTYFNLFAVPMLFSLPQGRTQTAQTPAI